MTAIESARNFLKSKERKPYLRSSNFPRKIIQASQDQKDVVSAGGKLIICFPYNN
jgi:hypothetical protein